MQNDQIFIDFLKENGYSNFNDKRMLGEANWEIFKKGTSEVLCVCNDKPPQFHIKRFIGETHGHPYDYVEFYIWGETDMQGTDDKGAWLHAKITFDVKYVMKNLDVIEHRCMRIWEAANNAAIGSL